MWLLNVVQKITKFKGLGWGCRCICWDWEGIFSATFVMRLIKKNIFDWHINFIIKQSIKNQTWISNEPFNYCIAPSHKKLETIEPESLVAIKVGRSKKRKDDHS